MARNVSSEIDTPEAKFAEGMRLGEAASQPVTSPFGDSVTGMPSTTAKRVPTGKVSGGKVLMTADTPVHRLKS